VLVVVATPLADVVMTWQVLNATVQRRTCQTNAVRSRVARAVANRRVVWAQHSPSIVRHVIHSFSVMMNAMNNVVCIF